MNIIGDPAEPSMAPWGGDDFHDHEEDPDAYDPFEEAMSNCSWTGVWGHVCGAVGSEDCDWDCPLSSEMWRGLDTPRDEKGRFISKVKT